MNRFYTTYIVVLLFTLGYTEQWEVGLFGAHLTGHKDLGHYWEQNFGAGFEVFYPFHDQVPVSLSVHISDHREKREASILKGHVRPGRDILLLHTALQWHYRFLPTKKFHPLIGAGLSNTLFLMYDSWPPESNDDESEYGISFSTGAEFDMGEKFRLFADYRHSFFLTDPHIVHFSLIRFGVRFRIPKRSHEEM